MDEPTLASRIQILTKYKGTSRETVDKVHSNLDHQAGNARTYYLQTVHDELKSDHGLVISYMKTGDMNKA